MPAWVTGAKCSDFEELHGKLWPLQIAASPFPARVKDEAVPPGVKPKLLADVNFTEWTGAGEMRHPVYLGRRADKRTEDVVIEKEKAAKRRS
jgi:bifunctional non-homologous end joining protein LigD